MTSVEGTLAFALSHNYFSKILAVSDSLQFLIYMGFLLYLFVGIGRKSDSANLFIPALVIGGILFSMIWEAKARYILPYYIVMFPMAVIAYAGLFDRVLSCVNDLNEEKR